MRISTSLPSAQPILPDGESGIIVACRGTLPPSLNDPARLFDWLQDFFADPTSSVSGP
jgi:hypothetical protein